MATHLKTIGIVPLVDEERQSYWMLPGYMKCIEQAGAMPIMLPLTSDPAMLSQLTEMFDGFLFSGGHDVSPSLYGEQPTTLCGTPCPERDAMEQQLLKLAIEKDKPVFGICRGIQFFNALLGGTLYQDLPSEHPSTIDHHMHAPYDRAVHDVSIVQGSPLAELLGKDTIAVNSYHHQAIRQIAPCLEAMAYSPDGLVEAVCLPSARFAWAVQWHPEFSYNAPDEAMRSDSMKIISHFVSKC